MQLQVICSDIWESAAPGEKVISRKSLPKDWSVDVGLGRFYDQAIDFAVRPSPEPTPRATSAWSRMLALVGWRSYSPIRVRRWISKSLITAMGTRAPVLVQDAQTEIPGGVLERLQHRYLLRLEPRFGADWLELAHDRLVGPITRSNARRIAASNHKQVGLRLAALFLIAGGWGWHSVQIERAEKARDQLVADMKKEIAAEPDLGMLIQACAHSRSLEGSPASGPSCPVDDRMLSEQIVDKQGAEEFATRQQELHAYVRSPFGAIVNLARQGNSYRATLDNGKYFLAGFETPTIPSEADLKASAPSNPGSRDIAPATDIAATDASQDYVIASRCFESCVTQVRMLNNRSDDWAPVELDRPAAAANTIVRGIAASGSTLVYAVCGQGSGLECPAQVKVYQLSARQVKRSVQGNSARDIQHRFHGGVRDRRCNRLPKYRRIDRGQGLSSSLVDTRYTLASGRLKNI